MSSLSKEESIRDEDTASNDAKALIAYNHRNYKQLERVLMNCSTSHQMRQSLFEHSILTKKWDVFPILVAYGDSYHLPSDIRDFSYDEVIKLFKMTREIVKDDLAQFILRYLLFYKNFSF